jgi:hypothetical protein
MVDAPMKHAVERKLPPAPAPTSRDANPWAMPGAKPQQRIPGLRIDPARLPERLKVPPAKPVDAVPGGERKARTLRWVPVVILGGMFIALGGNALESFRRGDFVGALVPLVFVGFVAVGMLRSLLRQKR